MSHTERKKEGIVLESQSSHQKPELQWLESKLHFTVEGVQSELPPIPKFLSSHLLSLEDMLLVRFTCIDISDPNHDFNIVVDVSTPVYRGNRITFLSPPYSLFMSLSSPHLLSNDFNYAYPHRRTE